MESEDRMSATVLGVGKSSPPSPPSLSLSTQPQPASIECEVVFHVQDDQEKKDDTANSPFHHNRTRFQTAVPRLMPRTIVPKGRWFKQEITESARNLDNIERRILSVVSQREKGRPITAQKLLRAFRNPVDPDDPEARKKFEEFQNRARRLLQIGDDVNAETCLNEVHKLFPGNADTFFNLGTIEHFFRNDIEKATEFYKMALECDENHASTLLNLAAVQLWKGNKRACEAHLRDVLFVDKKNCDAMCSLGVLYLTDNAPAAETWFKKVLDVDPTHETALYNYGTLLYSLGKAEGKKYTQQCSNPSMACRALVSHSIAYPTTKMIDRRTESSASSLSSRTESSASSPSSLSTAGSRRSIPSLTSVDRAPLSAICIGAGFTLLDPDSGNDAFNSDPDPPSPSSAALASLDYPGRRNFRRKGFPRIPDQICDQRTAELHDL